MAPSITDDFANVKVEREEWDRIRSTSSIYPRMLGYSITLTMHIINVVNMTRTFQGDVLQDPDVRQFHEDQNKYMTVWNVYMQILYAVVGLSCDVLSLANQGKDSPLLISLKKMRDPMFSCLVFPYAMMVATVFWTVFSYERSLILPPSVDKTLSWTSNHVIHTAVVPVALWELVFRSRRAPERHVANLALMYCYAATYLSVLVSSYIRLGTWVYPILNILNGTIYVYVFLGVSTVLVQVFYCLQWYLTDLIWGNNSEQKKVD